MDEAVYIIMTGPDGVSREWWFASEDEVGTLNRMITLLGEPDNVIGDEGLESERRARAARGQEGWV